MEIENQLEVFREAIRLRVERTSIRVVALESGLSHGCVSNLLVGGGRPRGKTLRLLREWYEARAARGEFPLTARRALYLADQLLFTIPSAERSAAEVELVTAIAELYRRRALPLPQWLLEMDAPAHPAS